MGPSYSSDSVEERGVCFSARSLCLDYYQELEPPAPRPKATNMGVITENTVRAMIESSSNLTKSYLETFMNSFRTEMNELREMNSELKRSLEFSQAEIVKLKADLARVTDLPPPQQNEDVSNRVRILEDETKKENLRIVGMEETASENFEQTQAKVTRLISERLGIENITIKNAHRAGKRPPQPNEKPRPIIAKLSCVEDKIKCLKSSSRLKDSQIYLSDDVSKATAKIRKEKLQFLKQKRSEGFIAYFSGAEVIFKKRPSPRRDDQTPPEHGNSGSNTSTSSSSYSQAAVGNQPPTTRSNVPKGGTQRR